MENNKPKWPDVDSLIRVVEAGLFAENDVTYDAREALTELVRGFNDNVALFRDGWAEAQVAADNAPYRPAVSVCFDCGPVDACDEDRCCLSCGRDLIDVQGDVSVEVLADAADELRAEVKAAEAERDAAVARAEAAEGLIGRRGAIKVTGNRNDGWRGDLVDPDDNGYWFRTAGYDSRDAVVVTLFHWAVVNDVAVVG